MPKHLTALDAQASLPGDASVYEPGYPIVVQGILYKVNAAQDGFEVVGGGVGLRTVTAAHVADNDGVFDNVVLADATSAAFDVTLPDAPPTGRVLTVKKTDASANAVTVQTPNAETIDGAASHALASQYDVVTVVYDGTNWLVM